MHIHRQPGIEALRALLDACALPHEDLDGVDLSHFLACGPRAAPCGVVGLEMLGEAALLRSLAVAGGARGRGCGAALLAAAERHAAAAGVRTLYLLTDTAADYFRRHGWRALARASAPDAVRATRQFSSLCPDSALLMGKDLAGPAAVVAGRA